MRRWLSCVLVAIPCACSSPSAGDGGSSSGIPSTTTTGGESSAGTSVDATTTGATTSSSGPMGDTTDGLKLDLGLLPDLGGGDDTGPLDESTCELAAMSLTSAGCVFAPTVGSATTNLPWAVVAANTSGLVAANVTLFDLGGNPIESAVVDPGGLYTFVLAANSPALVAHAIGSTTQIDDRVMRLESDLPVVAYQFSPYSSSQVATADASLLLPEHAWGTDYLVPSYHNSDFSDSWVTIVSLADDNDVTIEMPAAMVGATSPGAGIPGLGAGESHVVTLQSQEFARFVSPGGGVADLTGARITSTAPVAVVTGSPSMSLPGPGMNFYKDYLEEQVPPRVAWGTEIAVVKFRPRSDEPDLYRILADADGTTITIAGGYADEVTLDEGEFLEFLTPESFTVTASDAVLVTHYMVSQDQASGPKNDLEYPGDFISANCANPSQDTTELGDPAVSFVAPTEQYRYNYTFLTPETYAWDMVTITGPIADWGSIELDGAELPDPTPIAGSTLGFARFLVEDGPHDVRSATARFGLEVYGYDCRISYAYPGGMSLGEINEPAG
ncbi:MAG: IgGFc-binding protein [Myxococcales bacterium]|nr:IgGFc-binding protein [Myxococcales bacterium]